jgi:hypothetical protein
VRAPRLTLSAIRRYAGTSAGPQTYPGKCPLWL